MILRSSGYVEALDVLRGTNEQTGRPWEMHVAKVRTNAFVVAELTLSQALVGQFQQGDVVDLIVDVSASGGRVRTSALGVWPQDGVGAVGLHSVAV